MPAKLVQIRRGTTSNHSIFVGETGEITVDTDKDTVVVHDKATAGGHPLAKEDMTNVNNAVGIAQLKVDQVTPPSTGQVLSVDNMNGLTFSTIDVSAEAVGGDLSGTVANAQINANTIGITELNLNDGNDGQFLKTNGAGVISFGTVPVPDISAEPVGGDVTGTVGNIQIPNNSITSAMIAPGVIVAQDIATNAVNGTHLAMGSDAAGDTLYYDGTDYVRLAKGTAGQVLTMNGGATAPEWAAGTGGGISNLVEDTSPQLGGVLDFNGHKFTNHILPSANDTYDIGSAEFKIRDMYVADNTIYMGDDATIKAEGTAIVVQDLKTGDLHLDNTHRNGNSVDGTSGSWTFEEGDENLFLLNNITGKKYKINLTEIE
tara:strand:- start:7168 stop:8289 length:1122 start_codon:yes stop_codon:yes gene_type:complete